MPERETATGDVGLIQAFVNTLDMEPGTEALQDPGALRDWLVAKDLMDAAQPAGEDDLKHAIALREAMRAVGAMGRLVAALYAAMQSEEWDRLKLCGSGSCRWAFYDRSKNHSSRWCTMASCGNRAKARRFRQKEKASSSKARG